MRLDDMRELLEIHSFNYLYALRNSEPFGRDEHPSVYLERGFLQGVCATKDYYFKEEKYWKITFYKSNDKIWFVYTLPDMTEEQADDFVEYRNRRWREDRKLLSEFIGL